MEQESPTEPPCDVDVYEIVDISDPPRYTEIPSRSAHGADAQSKKTQPDSTDSETYAEVVSHTTLLPSPTKKAAEPARSKKPKLKKRYSDPLQPQKVTMRQHDKPRSKKSRSLSLHEEQMPILYDDLDTTYSLTEFVHKYSSSFPLRITVESGMCSSTEENDNISTGDIYDVHFMKYTTVVHISTQTSQMYAVPLNSVVQFGLVYNPRDNLQEALKGLMFESVSELLEMKPLPKIIRATKNYLGGANSSVTANEILLVLKTSKLKVVGYPLLRVYSLTKQMKKALHPQCNGHFTTSPKGVSLCLPDILQHLPDPFPLEVVAYSHAGDLPEQLTAHVVTLTHSSIETSIIASAPNMEEGANGVSVSSSGTATILDIPLTLDIDVSVTRLNEIEEQHLHFTTRELYESFEPSKVKACLPKAASSEAFTIQSQLLKLVSKNNIKEGIELGKPERAYSKPHRTSLGPAMLSTQFEESLGTKENAMPTPPLPPRNSHTEKSEPVPSESSPLSDPDTRVEDGESAQPAISREKQQQEQEEGTVRDQSTQQSPDQEPLNVDASVPTGKQASNDEGKSVFFV